MHVKKLNVALLVASAAGIVQAKVDVSKGEDVIPPDSKEAAAFHHSDKAVKTSPKDKTAAEDLLEGDKFRKSEPKLDHQKIDVPDTESLGHSQENGEVAVVAAAKSGDEPIVLNDYDPNNLGVTTENNPDLTDAKTNKHSEGSGSAAGTSDKTNTGGYEDGEKKKTSSETPNTSTSLVDDETNVHGEGGQSHLNSFTMALSMIIFSEIGDKTFLIAALMAMRHARWTVFSAAFSSLVVMTVLSAFLGHALPHFLPKKVTSLLAAVLFVVFGIKLIREGLAMDARAGVDDELEEVEHEIEAKELISESDELEKGNSGPQDNNKNIRRATSSPRLSQDGLENGSGDAPLYTSRSKKTTQASLKDGWNQVCEGVTNLASLVLSPTWVQVFVMTFLGEWGDRSQVATIAMAAGSDYWFVIFGAIAGHGLCTAAAVLGGKLLAAKISMRHVTLAGAVAFLIFAIIYFVEGISLPW